MDFRAEILKAQIEIEEVRKYVLERPLRRPKTNVFTVILIVLIYLCYSFLISYGIVALFHIEQLGFLVFIAVYIVNLLLISNYLSIKIVECYQHYASEERRRRCVCKPTCSEYAIAVLWKYNIFKALHKIRIRLYKTCQGDYKVDNP